ncbi:MAG: hypothetical protein KAI47_03825 [Deltaproteobacteria bacterium]|nr:hypothetical protein [Deltaproteobacteria bacterium]
METKDDGEEMPEHQPALVALVGDFRRDNDAAHLTNAIHAMKDVSKAGLFVIGALPEAHGTVQGQRCKDRGARTETQGTVHGQLLERCDGVINVTHGLDLYAQVAIATRGLFDGLFVHGLIGYDDIDMLTAMHTGDVFSFDRCNELPALRPLPNGPWVFARHDIVAAAAARQATGQTDRRRRIRGVDPSSEQRNLEITNT